MNYRLSLRQRMLLFIVLPTVMVALYYGLLASDMYVSESHFAIRGPESSSGSDLLALFGQSGGSTSADAHVVQDYILSADMLQLLEARCGFRGHYQGSGADFFSRLAGDATAEEALDYYRDIITVGFDTTSGILALKIRAYTPEKARELAGVILEESERLVNRLSDQALQDSLALSRSELATAEARLTAAREALRTQRRKTDILSPEAAAGAAQNLVAALEAETAKTRAQLAEARAYMRESSPQVATLKIRVDAIDRQIAEEKARLTGGDGRGLSDMVSDFERYTIEHEFAQKHYVSALASLEAARIRGESKSRYLVAFARPTLPEEARYPQRLLFIGLALAIFSLFYGIAALVIAAIREHVGV